MRGGRPPISETKVALLRGAFERGYGTAKAAKICGVHRNTAIAYFARFRAGTPDPARGEARASERAVVVRDCLWADLGKAAKKRAMGARELAALILTVVVEDDLLRAVLAED